MKRFELIKKIINSVDGKNGKAFSEFFSENGKFIYANNEPVTGRKNIENYVDEFFKFIKKGEHTIKNLWDEGDCIVWQGDVTYTRHDDKAMIFPYVNILSMNGDVINEYQIYIDNTKLFAD